MIRFTLLSVISFLMPICNAQPVIKPKSDLNNALNIDQKFGYNSKLIGSDAAIEFFSLYKYKIYNGYVNTTGYVQQFKEINREPEVLRFVLPKESASTSSRYLFLGYFITTEANQSYGSYIGILKLDYENYSQLYIDQNLDQDFNNDGEPIVLSYEDSEITARLKFLNYNIETNFLIPNSKIDPYHYFADTLIIKRGQLPYEQRFKTYQLWDQMVNKREHIFITFTLGAGGGGSQKVTYSSNHISDTDYIIEGFSFTRVGLGLQAGYEFRNIVFGANYGFEFWRISDFFRELKEGEVLDKFGAVREDKNGLPKGFSYYGGSLGYNINISHKLLIQPSIQYGFYSYIESSGKYNQLQKNRVYQSANLTLMVPISQRFLINAGASITNFKFSLPERITTVVISQEQELALSRIKMSSVSFQFGTTFRL